MSLFDDMDPWMSPEKKQEKREERAREREKAREEYEEREQREKSRAGWTTDEPPDHYSDDGEYVYHSTPQSRRSKRGCRLNCFSILAIIIGLPFCMFLVSPIVGPVINHIIEFPQ